MFLNLENVRGQSDATAFSVYLGVGEEEDPAEHPERLAGSIAPFGVSQATLWRWAGAFRRPATFWAPP